MTPVHEGRSGLSQEPGQGSVGNRRGECGRRCRHRVGGAIASSSTDTFYGGLPGDLGELDILVVFVCSIVMTL